MQRTNIGATLVQELVQVLRPVFADCSKISSRTQRKENIDMSDWQSAPSKKKPKRTFVGNLNNDPDIEEKVRELFSRSGIIIQAIEIVPLKLPNTKCYALVECDIGSAVRCLNGMQFEGNRLNVKSEKKDFNGRKKKGMGFGGGWAAPTVTPSQAPAAPQRSKIGGQESASVKPNGNSSIKTSQVEQSLDEHLSASMDKIDLQSNDKLSTKESDDVSSFHTRCKVSLKDMMEDYGTHDPDYEKMKAMNVGDVAPHPPSNSAPDVAQKSTTSTHSGMLAPNGKAPIHIELVSFGFKYSVPPQARDGWSYSNPLSPIDCRDLPRCPHYVSKLSGLSHRVKRAMLSATIEGKESDDNEGVDSDEDGVGTTRVVNPLLTKIEEVSITILHAIEEAINEGGHGYAFPLESAIYFGSEYGRHRSIVLCEKLAQTIRTLLRENADGRITQPVSVSTRHRDVDQKHKDDEAFGNDLRKKHDAEVKRKKRQEWQDSKW